jgi:hypothetical protein
MDWSKFVKHKNQAKTELAKLGKLVKFEYKVNDPSKFDNKNYEPENYPIRVSYLNLPKETNIPTNVLGFNVKYTNYTFDETTNLIEWTKIFDKFNINYELTTFIDKETNISEYHLNTDEGVGYDSFTFDLVFNEEGKFIRYGVWE